MAGGVMVEAGLGYLENQQLLEAALVLRRVVDEPRWEAHRLRGGAWGWLMLRPCPRPGDKPIIGIRWWKRKVPR